MMVQRHGTMRKHRSRQRRNGPLQVYAIDGDGDYGSITVLKSPRHQPC